MERKSNFELLRLILMILIVIHHCIAFGIGFIYTTNPADPNFIIKDGDYPILAIINAMCIIGVNTFIIISGFFKINFSLKKVLKLLFFLLIYRLIFRTAYIICLGQPVDILSNLRFISQTDYWFLKDYILLMFFAPLINKFFECSTKKEYLIFTTVLIIASCYFGFLWEAPLNSSGYCFFQFLTMYSIGRVIAIHNIKTKKILSFGVYIFAAITTGIIMTYYFKKGDFHNAYSYTFYNSPLIMIASIAFFLLFTTINFKSKRFNQIAKYSLGIYLFQSAPMIGNIMYPWIKNSYLTYGLPLTLLITLGLTLGCAIIALPIHALLDKFVDCLIELPQIFKNKEKQDQITE